MTDQTPDTNKKPVALEERSRTADARMMSPSVARNKDLILEVLRPHLSSGMSVLELASGTGEHGAHIMSEISGLTWQPSDLSEEARTSITAWADYLDTDAFKVPIALDVRTTEWPLPAQTTLDAILCINMIHIAPFEAAQGVVSGAARYLGPGGFLFFYGPFKRDGKHTAPSNEAFDQSLRSRDPSWGVRDLEAVEVLANQAGLRLESVTPMPANNLSLVIRR